MSKLPRKLRWEKVANVLKKLGYELRKRSGTHALFVNKEGKMVTIITKSPMKAGTLEAVIDKLGIDREKFLEML